MRWIGLLSVMVFAIAARGEEEADEAPLKQQERLQRYQAFNALADSLITQMEHYLTMRDQVVGDAEAPEALKAKCAKVAAAASRLLRKAPARVPAPGKDDQTTAALRRQETQAKTQRFAANKTLDAVKAEAAKAQKAIRLYEMRLKQNKKSQSELERQASIQRVNRRWCARHQGYRFSTCPQCRILNVEDAKRRAEVSRQEEKYADEAADLRKRLTRARADLVTAEGKLRGAESGEAQARAKHETLRSQLGEVDTPAKQPGQGEPSKYPVYVLKDGRRIVAKMKVEMGDMLIIKDDKGKSHKVKKADVKEIHPAGQ